MSAVYRIKSPVAPRYRARYESRTPDAPAPTAVPVVAYARPTAILAAPAATARLSVAAVPNAPATAQGTALPAARARQYATADTPLYVLYAAMALGYSVDLLFYGHALGLSVPLFALLLLGTLFFVAARRRVPIAYRNVMLLVPPILFFATMVFVRANATLTTINIAVLIVLFLLLAFYFARGHLERLGILGYLATPLQAAAGLLTRPVPAVSYALRDVREQKHRYRHVGPLLRGVLIAVPVLLVFTLLLYSADSIFAKVVDKALKLNIFDNTPEFLWRLAIVAAAAWIIAGFLYLATARTIASAGAAYPPTTPLSPDTQPPVPARHLGFMEGVVVLSLVNLLFLLFGYIQVVYLFSGEARRTLDYEAYREYVRSGFGQLLVAAVLTMGLILGLKYFVWKETRREVNIFNLLCSLMIALAMVMLVSAFWRMLVWESVQFYISTPTRIYVRWFIIWLGATFAWLLGTTWLRPNRFAIGAFVATLGFLVSVNLANPDADVAAYNLSRHDELSVRYLYLLSEDAIPVLAAGLDSTTGIIHDAIRSELSYRLNYLEQESSLHGWQSFHLSRNDAYQILSELKRSGKLDPREQSIPPPVDPQPLDRQREVMFYKTNSKAH